MLLLWLVVKLMVNGISQTYMMMPEITNSFLMLKEMYILVWPKASNILKVNKNTVN